MSELHTRTWSPITDLPADLSVLLDSELATFARAWQDQASDLREREAYREFLVRLRRQWAIETGVLERLYSLSEGASKTLIEKGLDAAFIGREDTDRPPNLVAAMINDHYQAIEGLYQFVSRQRQLTISYLRELRQVLTANQEFCDAIDHLGQPISAPLNRGDWKKWPNNIRFEDGSMFEFCPPEQVASEIDQLLAWHREHQAKEIPPEIEAAWLHHRFTLIHPFQDGNGRVARCLATLVMLRAHWFPLVVVRGDRLDYILALRAADSGDLAPLVKLFGSLQKRAIREALSLSKHVIEGTQQIQTILATAGEKLSKRQRDDDERRTAVATIGDALPLFASDRLRDIAASVDCQVKRADPAFAAFHVSTARGDPRSYYYQIQIVQCARTLGYFANFRAFQAWAALVIKMAIRTHILFSFHGIGTESRGFLACSCMLFQKELGWAEDNTRETRVGDVSPLSAEPFQLNYLDDPRVVQENFGRWLDRCAREGLATWTKSL